MEQNENKYMYAKKEAQVLRTNHFAQIGYLVFYTILLIVIWSSYAGGARSIGFSAMCTVIILTTVILNTIVYKINGSGIWMRYATPRWAGCWQ